MKTIDFLVEVVAQRVSSEVSKKFDVKMDEMFDAYNQQLSELTKKAKEEPQSLTDPNDEYGIETHPEEGLHGNDEFEKDSNEPSTKEQFEEGENLQTLIDEMGASQSSELIKNEGELTRQAVAQVKNEIIDRLDRQQIREAKKDVDKQEEQEKKVKQKEEKDEKRRKKDKKDLDKKLSSMSKNTGKRSKLLVALGVGAIILWWRPIWSIMETAFEKILGKDWKEKVENKIAQESPGLYTGLNRISSNAYKMKRYLFDREELMEGSPDPPGFIVTGHNERALFGLAVEDWTSPSITPADVSAMVNVGMDPKRAVWIQNYAKKANGITSLFGSPADDFDFYDPIAKTSYKANGDVVKYVYNAYRDAGVDMGKYADYSQFVKVGISPELVTSNPLEDDYVEMKMGLLENQNAEDFERARWIIERDKGLVEKYGVTEEGVWKFLSDIELEAQQPGTVRFARTMPDYYETHRKKLEEEHEDYKVVDDYIKSGEPTPRVLTPHQQEIYKKMVTNTPVLNISNIMVGNRQPSHTE